VAPASLIVVVVGVVVGGVADDGVSSVGGGGDARFAAASRCSACNHPSAFSIDFFNRFKFSHSMLFISYGTRNEHHDRRTWIPSRDLAKNIKKRSNTVGYGGGNNTKRQ